MSLYSTSRDGQFGPKAKQMWRKADCRRLTSCRGHLQGNWRVKHLLAKSNWPLVFIKRQMVRTQRTWPPSLTSLDSIPIPDTRQESNFNQMLFTLPISRQWADYHSWRHICGQFRTPAATRMTPGDDSADKPVALKSPHEVIPPSERRSDVSHIR